MPTQSRLAGAIPACVQRGIPVVSRSVISTGFRTLDAVLNGGGWPKGVLTELRPTHMGIGELRLLFPVLAHIGRHVGWVAWIDPPFRPYAPVLVAHQFILDRLVLIRPKTHKEALWAVSETLRSPAIGAVVSWFTSIKESEFRALQRVTESSHKLGFCFLSKSSPICPSRLRLGLDSQLDELCVRILKQSGHPVSPIYLNFF